MKRIVVEVELPEGATHVLTDDVCLGVLQFYKIEGGILRYFNTDEQCWMEFDEEFQSDVINQIKIEMKPIQEIADGNDTGR